MTCPLCGCDDGKCIPPTRPEDGWVCKHPKERRALAESKVKPEDARRRLIEFVRNCRLSFLRRCHARHGREP
jgi:hypothetical protein